jgi:hypothetical protein
VLYGVGAQPLAEQRALVEREGMPYPLLNDSGFALASALALPTFSVDGMRLYKRLTLGGAGRADLARRVPDLPFRSRCGARPGVAQGGPANANTCGVPWPSGSVVT